MRNRTISSAKRFATGFCLISFCLTLSAIKLSAAPVSQALTPAQIQIEKERQRLNSSDAEERRDALMHLGAMRTTAAAKACLVGLTDAVPINRAVAAQSILALSPEESVPALLPLLNDKDEFVRREAVHALGLTRSRSVTSELTGLLLNDKKDSVRSAAAIALGRIGDESVVVTLATVLSPELTAANKGKRKAEKSPFVLRAAAAALGRTKSRAGTPSLIAALANDKLPSDVRREAAHALGLIGDPAAVPSLRAAAQAADPYLSEAAFEALKKIGPP
jgi:HEAT repeat protein